MKSNRVSNWNLLPLSWGMENRDVRIRREHLSPHHFTTTAPISQYRFPHDQTSSFGCRSTWWERIRVRKITLFIISFYTFTLAIILMKDGARSFAPLLQSTFSINNLANCFGFGWLFAYIIMSGSPGCCGIVGVFRCGVINKIGAFAMITGSRLGASFIVLFIGFLYVLRGRDRSTGLSMGLYSLIVTFTTYLPGFFWERCF